MRFGKKKQQGRTKSILFKGGASKKRRSSGAGVLGPRLVSMLKLLGAVSTLCGIAIGLVVLDKYVGETTAAPEDGWRL